MFIRIFLTTFFRLLAPNISTSTDFLHTSIKGIQESMLCGINKLYPVHSGGNLILLLALDLKLHLRKGVQFASLHDICSAKVSCNNRYHDQFGI